jgi:uncharacterized protein (UPF0264 family)
MGGVEAYTKLAAEPVEEMEQAQRIRASGYGHHHRLAGVEQAALPDEGQHPGLKAWGVLQAIPPSSGRYR